MSWFRTRRRVVVNGQLVESQTIDLEVKWKRSLLLLGIFATLWWTNPYNNPDIHVDGDAFADYHWTSYAFFSVRARRRGDGFNVFCLGQDLTCYYEHKLCRQLEEYLCHERPLIWDPKDRVYTTHRILVWIYFVLACMRWCTNLDHMLHLETIVSCGFSLIVPTWRSYLEALWILLPVWDRMNYLVPLQANASFPRILGSDGANYTLSVVLFYFLASLCVYTTTCYWNANSRDLSLSPSSHLTAVALGFVRGSVGHRTQRMNSVWLRFPPFSFKVSPISLTWTTFALQLATGGVSCLIPWWMANLVGALFGEFMFQNQQMMHVVASMMNEVQDLFQSLFQLNR